jgi:ferritin
MFARDITMLDAKIEKALNRQINHEMASAYDYLAMSGFFEHRNLSGFASWMAQQRSEELVHAGRLVKYLLDRGGKLDLDAIPKPGADYKSVRAAFTHAVELEVRNTSAINELYELATKVKDYATMQHLHWFLEEQVEEEKSMTEVLGLLEIAGDNPSALLDLNRQLAQRGKTA